MRIEPPVGQQPLPVTELEIFLPGNLGIATSGLGFETCNTVMLEAKGLAGCPSDSLMGYGSAAIAVPVGQKVIVETMSLTLLSGPVHEGNLGLLFYASGRPPIDAQLVFTGALLPAPTPFGGNLAITLPAIPSFPEGALAALVELQTTIGPSHIVYYEHIHGKVVPYRPKGILLPNRCPRGGFLFRAQLTFEDATHVTAHTTVPCSPPRRRRS